MALYNFHGNYSGFRNNPFRKISKYSHSPHCIMCYLRARQKLPHYDTHQSLLILLQCNIGVVWLKDFMGGINKILAAPLLDLRPPKFQFEMTNDAAIKKWRVLEKYNLDLDTTLAAQSLLPLGNCSDFRPARVLDPLPKHHPLWSHIQIILCEGATYCL